MSDEIENYYIFLGLDPTVTDWETIRKHLEARKREWSEARTPEQKRKAQKGFAHFDDIRRALRDEETRLEQAREAQAIRKQQLEEAFDELRSAIEIRADSGTCRPEDIERLAQTYDMFSRDHIERAIREMGFAITEADETPAPDFPELLEETFAERLRETTDQAGFDDLYDYLDQSPGASASRLHTQASRRHDQLVEAGQHDYEANLRKRLAGLAMEVFETEASKSRYDRTLELWEMEHLDRLIVSSVREGVLDAEAIETLLEHAQRRDVSADMARFYLEREAESRGWQLVWPRHRDQHHTNEFSSSRSRSEPDTSGTSGRAEAAPTSDLESHVIETWNRIHERVHHSNDEVSVNFLEVVQSTCESDLHLQDPGEQLYFLSPDGIVWYIVISPHQNTHLELPVYDDFIEVRGRAQWLDEARLEALGRLEGEGDRLLAIRMHASDIAAKTVLSTKQRWVRDQHQ